VRALVFLAAFALYLPTARFTFVQDDRLIIEHNPTAHSLGMAVRGFGEPYWPPPNQGGLYRPLTILSYAVDWQLGGGRAWLFHIMNAAWGGLAALLVVLLVVPWLGEPAAIGVGLVFALHPVHVEAVAGIVGRADLLAAVGIFGSVLCARRRAWTAATLCAICAMFSKEYGVAAGPLILVDDLLRRGETRRYPPGFYASLALATAAFLLAWARIGSAGAGDVAPALLGAGPAGRLAVALPAVARAAWLLVWPSDLSADYGPQVIPSYSGVSPAALAGLVVVAATLCVAFLARRRQPALTLALVAGAVCYLPTSNLLFPSGVVLAERNLYVTVLIVAVLVGCGVQYAGARWSARTTTLAMAVLCGVLAVRSATRISAWRDNRTFLLTLLAEHPESYHAHASAAAVLAGTHDTADARAEYARADSLFPGDPHEIGAYALFLAELKDSGAVALAARARALRPREENAVRAQFLIAVQRGDRLVAQALADSAGSWYEWSKPWFQGYLR